MSETEEPAGAAAAGPSTSQGEDMQLSPAKSSQATGKTSFSQLGRKTELQKTMTKSTKGVSIPGRKPGEYPSDNVFSTLSKLPKN